MKILLTGFGPFLSYKTNPTETLAREFDKMTINGAKIKGAVLEVKHKDSGKEVARIIASEKPDAIVSTGLAATKGSIILERIALNRFYFRDREKGTEVDEPLGDGPLAYASTLPLSAMKTRLEKNGIPAEYSFWPDTAVSNEVFYNVMKTANKMGIPTAGFIHVPLTHYMVINNLNNIHPMTRSTIPSMDYKTVRKAIEIILAETAKRVKRL